MRNSAATSEFGTRLLREIAGFNGHAFNPTSLVKAVNWLHSRGKEQAVTDLENHLSRNPDNVLLVARLLFVPHEGGTPPSLQIGRPDVEAPQDSSVFPLFPLALQDDIPFLLVGGYYRGGESTSPFDYVNWCIHHSDIRATPLMPSNNPLQSVDQLLRSNTLLSLQLETWHDRMLRTQALRAVSNIYAVDEREMLALLTQNADEPWFRHQKNFRKLNAFWNPEICDYEKRPADEI